MSKQATHIDRPLLFITILLVLIGFFVFSSASLGLLARDGAQYSSVAFSQLVFGIGGGFAALLLLVHTPYRSYRPYAPHLFGAALLLTALVFVPGLGFEANGAQRWLDIFGLSLQPGEFLKVAFVLCLAWYFSTFHKRQGDIRFGLGGLAGLLGLAAVPVLLQPDTGTFLIMVAAGAAMAVAAGVRVQHLLLLLAVGCVLFAGLALSQDYLLDRIHTFLDPASDPSGSGYQIKQSLIAIGSGGVFGRGFGQSVQKFSYLPEPIGDSIFSVAAEEFGFLGSVVLLSLFVAFAIRGFHIAAHVPDRFGGLTVVGLVILIVTQSFMNIGSMVGIMPLTGEPLVFVSHGGTSLLVALGAVGMILNISRQRMKVVHI